VRRVGVARRNGRKREDNGEIRTCKQMRDKADDLPKGERKRKAPFAGTLLRPYFRLRDSRPISSQSIRPTANIHGREIGHLLSGGPDFRNAEVQRFLDRYILKAQ
jgi:hypothetical protein